MAIASKGGSRSVASNARPHTDIITIGSHRLKTPASAIRWALDSLRKQLTKKHPEALETVAEAYEQVEELLDTVEVLLRAARYEQGQVELKPQAVNPKQLVSDALKEAQRFASAANTKIIFTVKQPILTAWVDPAEFTLVFNSLLENAIQYSRRQGEIGVTLYSDRTVSHISITDCGVGIPIDEQPHLFDQFFRGKQAAKINPSGLGLNLYVAKRFFEQSGGTLTISSKVGQGTVVDFTLPQKNTQQLASSKKGIDQTLQREREFVAITVHELKAPLGLNKWGLEMLSSQKIGVLNQDQKEVISQLTRSNQRLLTLVRDLLDLSKLQEGRFEVTPHPINVAEVVKDVVASFATQAEQKKMKLTVNMSKSVPMILGDDIRITQVLTNLVSNAVKYTPAKGAVTIGVKKYNTKELETVGQKNKFAEILHVKNSAGYLVVSVEDTGMGISLEDQQQLFQRFFRSKKVMNSKTEGTGLGLYITKTIVDLHQGDIWFTSTPGKGSVFFVSFPIIHNAKG